MTQTPASGPFGPATTPPMSSASMGTSCEPGWAHADAAAAAVHATATRPSPTTLRIRSPPEICRFEGAAYRPPACCRLLMEFVRYTGTEVPKNCGKLRKNEERRESQQTHRTSRDR